MTQAIKKTYENIINPKEEPYQLVNKISNEESSNLSKTNCESNVRSLSKLHSTKHDYTHVLPHLVDDKLTDTSDSQNIPPLKDENTIKKSFLGKKRRTRHIQKKMKVSQKKRKNENKKNLCLNENETNDKLFIQKLIDDEEIKKNKNSKKARQKQKMSIDTVPTKVDEKDLNDEENQNNQKTSKNNKKIKNNKTVLNEKEMKLALEEKIMKEVNKYYSDEQYNEDLESCSKDKRSTFMRENFPSMFRKDKFYLYTVLLRQRRTQSKNFIQPTHLNEDIKQSKNIHVLYSDYEFEGINTDKKYPKKSDISKDSNQKITDNQLSTESSVPIASKRSSQSSSSTEKDKYPKGKPWIYKGEKDTIIKKKEGGVMVPREMAMEKESIKNSGILLRKTFNSLPKKVWSVPDEGMDIDIEKFYDDCIQIWPFNECNYIKAIALEFLMKNNYSSKLCFERLNDFVSFMKKRAIELDFPIQSQNTKTVKKYSLRKTNHN